MPESNDINAQSRHSREPAPRTDSNAADRPAARPKVSQPVKPALIVLTGVIIVTASVALVIYASSVQAAAPVAAGPENTGLAAYWLIVIAVVLALFMAGLHAFRAGGFRSNLETHASSARELLQFSHTRKTDKDTRRPESRGVMGSITGNAEFHETLHRHWHNCRSQSSYLALAVTEVDDFGALIDAFGHKRMNRRLIEMANSLNSLVEAHGGLFARQVDEGSPGRFMALFPNTTPDRALEIANELRLAVEDLGFDRPPPSRGVMTASVGVCIIVPSVELNQALLVSTAADALEQAKARGRSRIEAKMIDSERSFSA